MMGGHTVRTAGRLCTAMLSSSHFLRGRAWGARAVRHADERGQAMLEYAIIGGIVIIGALAVLVTLSGALNRMFAQIANTLSQY